MSEPPTRFARTPAQREDPWLAWWRPDRAFFAAGACHILAYTFAAARRDMRPLGLRARGAAGPTHVIASDGAWAFDHRGWTPLAELVRRSGDVRAVALPERLEAFCAAHRHRLPSQFPIDPRPRALAYIARFPVLPPD